MKVKHVVAGILLGIGLPISLLLAVDLSRKDNPNKADDIAAFLLFGFPPTVAGGLLARSLYQEAQKEKLETERQERDRLQSIFYQLLKNGKGRIAVLPFAMETQLSGEDAKQYLDARAKEFDATFDVNNDGGVTYCFHLGEFGSRGLTTSVNQALPQKALDVTPEDVPAAQLMPDVDEASTQILFDVILAEVPSGSTHQVFDAIQALTDLDWHEAVRLVNSLNSGAKPVQKEVDQEIAEFIRQKLKRAGAQVTIKPSTVSRQLTTSTKQLSSREKFDVILERVPSCTNEISMAQTIGVLIDQHWFKTIELVRSPKSKPIKKKVDKTIAEFMKQQLEKAGAEITLKLSK